MEFSRQEYWTGVPFPTPEDLHDPGIKPLKLDCYNIENSLKNEMNIYICVFLLEYNRSAMSC